MKLQYTDQHGQAIKINTGAEQAFTIKASPKVIDILSSGLYSDKIGSIIRELSSNARDSQILAGRGNEPFLVSLPNTMYPWFSIRDYGKGLTPEEIFTIYTTYFESTKTDSNDFVGQLGLGSKSPFAYVQSFNVISWTGGYRRTYAVYMDNGFPKISLTHETQSDEREGLEVKLPVQRKDFSEFLSKARLAYLFYSPKPTITGQDLVFPEMKPILQAGTAAVYAKRSSTHNASVMVVMGSVPYKVEVDKCDPEESIRALHQLQHTYDYFIVVDIPIGAIEVTASRESISYTPATVKNLKDIFTKAANDLVRKAKDMLISNKTLSEFLQLQKTTDVNFDKIYQYLTGEHVTFPIFNDQGLVITAHREYVQFQFGRNTDYTVQLQRVFSTLLTVPFKHTRDSVMRLSKAENLTDKTQVYNNLIRVEFNYPIIVLDQPWTPKLRRNFRNYVAEETITKKHSGVVYLVTPGGAIFDTLDKAFKFKRLSQIPEAPDVIRGSRVSTPGKKHCSYWANGGKIECTHKELTEIIKDDNNLFYSSDTYYCDLIRDMVTAFGAGKNVYGIMPSRFGKLPEEKMAEKKIVPWVTDFLANNKTMIEAYLKRRHVKGSAYSMLDPTSAPEIQEMVKALNEPISQYVETAMNILLRHGYLTNSSSKSSLYLQGQVAEKWYKNLCEVLEHRYPVLAKLVGGRDLLTDKVLQDHVSRYMKMINTTKGN